jgi:hypothetical protein
MVKRKKEAKKEKRVKMWTTLCVPNILTRQANNNAFLIVSTYYRTNLKSIYLYYQKVSTFFRTRHAVNACEHFILLYP